jgi:hypothetical protein
VFASSWISPVFPFHLDFLGCRFGVLSAIRPTQGPIRQRGCVGEFEIA